MGPFSAEGDPKGGGGGERRRGIIPGTSVEHGQGANREKHDNKSPE